MREKRVGLEDKTDSPLPRRNSRPARCIEPDVAVADHRSVCRMVQPGDRAQCRRLSAAGWTDQRQNPAGRYIEGDIQRNRLDLSKPHMKGDIR
jgi:hypothetical protein